MPGLKTLARGALDRTSLGSLMVREGIVDRSELDELLSEFKNTNSGGGFFGQFLIQKGVLTKEKLEFILIRQSAYRSGGVNSHHVAQAKRIAASTSKKLIEEVENFLDGMNKSLAKKGMSGDTRS